MNVFHLLMLFIPYVVCQNDQFGHLKPLGLHKESEGHIDILHEMISPKHFWDEYFNVGKPVILKSFGSNWPAFDLWSDEYLKEMYGNLRVKIEAKFEKEYLPAGDRGLGQDSIKHFIETYKTDNKYMVTQLPDPMAKEVSVPNCILCGSFYGRILEINMWMSSGNTTSLLHRDADNAINCLLAGKKEWVLIHPKYTDKLPVEVEVGDPYGGFTRINVNSVDFEKFPEMKNIPWNSAKMSAGDCLFLPTQYWHQVRSYEDRNVAVSILVSRLEDFVNTDCPDKSTLPTSKLLSEVPYVWSYDGIGTQTMGNPDPFEFNETLNEWCEDYRGVLNVDDILTILIEERDVNEYKGTLNIFENYEVSEGEIDELKKQADEILQLLDADKDGVFSCNSEKKLLKIDNLIKLSEAYDPDPANGEEYEFYHINKKNVLKLIRLRELWTKEEFIKTYLRSFKSSYSGGERLFSILDENSDEIIDRNEVNLNLKKCLDMFDRETRPDVVESKSGNVKHFIKTEL